MLFEGQVFDHSGLLLATMQMPAHGGDHLGLVGRPALTQGIGLHILIEQLVRVQFGAVAGQADQAQALRIVHHEAVGGNRAMRASIDAAAFSDTVKSGHATVAWVPHYRGRYLTRPRTNAYAAATFFPDRRLGGALLATTKRIPTTFKIAARDIPRESVWIWSSRTALAWDPPSPIAGLGQRRRAAGARQGPLVTRATRAANCGRPAGTSR